MWRKMNIKNNLQFIFIGGVLVLNRSGLKQKLGFFQNQKKFVKDFLFLMQGPTVGPFLTINIDRLNDFS